MTSDGAASEPAGREEIAACYRYLEAVLADAAALKRASFEGRESPELSLHEAEEEAATRTQMRFGRQDWRSAQRTVLEVANHLLTLAETFAWFRDARLRTAAMEESVLFALFDSEVASRPAQVAWRRLWYSSWPAREGWIMEDREKWELEGSEVVVLEAWRAAWQEWANHQR